MRRPFAALLLIISMLLADPAVAGRLDDAIAADERGDHATAYQLFQPLAEQGDRVAQGYLGVMFAKGQGVRQNYLEAVKWFRMAAEQGLAEAQYNLGNLYYNGRGVSQDYSEALKWTRKAADQGRAEAQYNLGMMYYNGQGATPNFILAHMWFDLAASRFPPSETEKRKDAASKRDIVASRMPPAHIAEAQRLAREWKPKEEGK